MTYDPEKHWRFSCTGDIGCGFTSFGDKPVSKCPSCELDGWNLLNTGPVVIGVGIPVRNRKVVFK